VHNISCCTHTSRRIDLFVLQLVKIIKLVMAARVRVLCIARRHESDDKRPRLFMDMLMNHTALLRGTYARRTTYIYVLKYYILYIIILGVDKTNTRRRRRRRRINK